MNGALKKLEEKIGELTCELSKEDNQERMSDELGDVLFTCVNIARHLKIDPDTALRHANNKFKYRFQRLEKAVKQENKFINKMDIKELESYWQQAKILD